MKGNSYSQHEIQLINMPIQNLECHITEMHRLEQYYGYKKLTQLKRDIQ